MTMTPTNGFTEGQKALIEQTAWKVADTVSDRLKDDMEAAIQLHQATCPIGKRFEAAANQAQGGARFGKLAWAAIVGIAGFVAVLVGIIKDMLK